MFNSTLFHSQNRITLPKSKGFGRLYNWYAASSRSLGMLYNWYAATDARNIAPTGWHMPTQNEYNTLINYCGGLNVLGIKLKEQGITYWVGPSNGTNEVGFNLIGCGFRSASFSGAFQEGKQRTYLRTTTLTILLYQGDDAVLSNRNEKDGYSIRLLKDDSNDTGIMTGNDGKQYATVKIGTQVWMAENLEETKFRNGDIIPVVTDNAAWAALSTAGSCWYNNTRTYNLAPVGWHLPNDNEYDTLIAFSGGGVIAGGKLKEVGTEHWNTPNTGATDDFGFSMLGAGRREGFSNALKTTGSIYINRSINNIYYNNIYTSSTDLRYNLYIGASVRFIRNINSVLTTNPTDSEGNSYETVTIGTQTWTKQNHKSKKWRTGESINVQDIYTDVQWQGLTVPACCAYNNDENNV